MTMNIADIYPLSPMQQGMLFHSLLAPTSGVYVEQYSCTLHGTLDVAAFAQAWQQVVDRHPILRTAFVWEDLEEPLQVVHEQIELPLQQLDWRSLAPAEQQAKVEELLRAERTEGFELSQAPLMRNILVRLADEAGAPVHLFIWCHHHLLIDGWCQPQLLQEVLAIYEAQRQRQAPQLMRRRPYRDYIAWLQEQDMARAEAFWRRTLAGVTAPTPLVNDHTGRKGQLRSDHDEDAETYRTARTQLSAESTAALQTIAQRHQLTLNTLVQGAWALLLHRYSGTADVLYGVTVSGRPPTLAGADTMMGVFINTLPVRVQIAPQVPLVTWLTQLQAQQAELREYEFTPLVQIQGWSAVPREVPLFESIFIFENFPVGDALRKHEGALHIRDVRSFAKTNYPLTVVAFPGTELTLRILYRETAFAPDFVARMLDHLQTLLTGMVEYLDQPVAHLPMLTAAERDQFRGWNATTREYPATLCAHERFAEIAMQQPDSVAVVFEERSLTYRELDVRANQLAHYLRHVGVGPESVVGICLERSTTVIVALLGILKAGGAFLPLDPSYPQDRLAHMLADSGTTLVLTQEAVATTLDFGTVQPIALDTAWPEIEREPTTMPALQTRPQNLAYVIYTSGSTGKPKGTLLQHTGICNLAVAQRDLFEIRPSDRILQFFSLSFDGAVWEIVMALLNGATLVLARHEQMAGEPLVDLLREQRITTITLAPSVLAVAPVIPLPDLRTIVTAGEACWQGLVERWGSERRFVNAYGPTETTVCAATYHCALGEPQDPPLGRPLANFQLHVLDDQWQPVPVGVPGELYLGGAGLARGYHQRPDLTAERFVPDPFSQEPGARLYRTGDLARYRADGNVEFLGRIDHQVKVRGFRIELGEIEAAIAQQPAVRDVAVLVQAEPREDSLPHNQQLVAYLVADGATAVETSELRRRLGEQLPDYMVPSAFVLLAAMPLTPAGKIDRAALPAPDWEAHHADAFVAPRTPVEELLCELWADVLGRTRVGITDNFFHLGGHSLLATQLISRMRNAIDLELPLHLLFERPTVAALGAHVEEAMATDSAVARPPLQPMPRQGSLPLSFAQQRLWFLEKLAPQSAFYNIPAAVRLRGEVDVAALEQSLQTIVNRHEVMRTTFADGGTTAGAGGTGSGEAVQVIAPTLPLTLPVVDLGALPPSEREAEAARLAKAMALQPFDLARGPLFRAQLLRLQADHHILLFVMHHIISDGWSMGVMIGELGTLYRAFCAGEPNPLPPVPLQYGDFALWQREWLQGAALEAQLRYWKRELAGCPERLELPTDRPRPHVQSFRGADHSWQLPPELTLALKALSRREGVTLFMTLLAGFQSLLHRYSGQQDILVGSPIANRTQAETEALIGFFVNTLVMRTDFSGDPTFLDLLQRVRKSALGAYAHQDLPFEQVVDAVQPTRNMSYSPLFQVVFSLQTRTGQKPAAQTMALPNLRVEPFSAGSGTARYDLTLVMTETDDMLLATLEYNTDLFDLTTITRFVAHFMQLLEAACANPEQQVSTLPLLSGGEERQLLREWAGVASAYPHGASVHELFAAQAAATPDAVALVFGDATLSYRELNERANGLAHHLQRLGVGLERPVGLCMERSLEMVIGTLAILKAGGAYLPLDPTYPAERLAFMLADAQPGVVLSQSGTQAAVAAALAAAQMPGVTTLALDGGELDSDGLDSDVLASDGLDSDELLAQRRADNPASAAGAENLAYIMYTSGSTGRPKGTCIRHRSVVRLVKETNFAKLGADEVWLQFAPISFDAATLELWGSLLNGGKLVIFPPHTPALAELGEIIRREGVTSLWLTAGLFHLMVDERLEDLRGVRQLLAGGDVLSVPHVRKVLTELPGCTLINGYGPTENTTFTCCHPMTTVDAVGNSVSIGKPIANTEVYILDRQLRPVPVGVAGELYVGGAGLARAYLHRAALTAERFVPHPYSAEAGARLYRTGDLVRWLADGTIEFLGRGDTQVKVRGFRIELGEIETALVSHPAIRAGVVVARGDNGGRDDGGGNNGGGKQLVAYTVVEREPAPSAGELRQHLQDMLPDYMVPAVFVMLDALPLNANGKVDRQALPAPEETQTDDDAYIAPRTPAEEALATAFRQVLHVEQIGIHDNFFELGGDSIGSIQLIARAAQVGIHLTVAQIFQQPTIAGLAALPDLQPATLAEQGPVTGSAPLTPIQTWFFDQAYPTPHHWNWAFLFEVPQPLAPDLLAQTVEALLHHHDALRMRFVQDEGEWRQWNAPPSADAPPVTVVDLAAVAAAELSATIEAEAARIQQTLDLCDGPLLRVVYFTCGAAPNRLLIFFHHLVVDGVSVRILLEDFQTIYRQLVAETAVTLPAKTTAYRTWAQRLWEHAQSDAMRQELAQWVALLAEHEKVPLPLDYPNGDNREGSSDRVAVALSSAETTALLQQVPARYGTQINDLLLTALARTIAAWSGTRAVLIETEGHGREPLFADLDLSRTVGWFSSMYTMVLDLGATTTAVEALQTVQAQIRALPQNGIGYGLLRYRCQETSVQQQMAALPRAEVNFNYLGQFDQGELSEAALRPARERTGPVRNLNGMRTVPLYILGSVSGGQLSVQWSYSRNLHDRATIERVAARYLDELRALIENRAETSRNGHGPQDRQVGAADPVALVGK